MSNGIFGYTGKVPDPRFVYQTTYPNRFRGSDWSIPRFGLPFVENPMAKPPFAGLGGCGCGGMQKVGGSSASDFGAAAGDAPIVVNAYASMVFMGSLAVLAGAALWKWAEGPVYDSSKKDW
jgi:hypothetical protein